MTKRFGALAFDDAPSRAGRKLTTGQDIHPKDVPVCPVGPKRLAMAGPTGGRLPPVLACTSDLFLRTSRPSATNTEPVIGKPEG